MVKNEAATADVFAPLVKLTTMNPCRVKIVADGPVEFMRVYKDGR